MGGVAFVLSSGNEEYRMVSVSEATEFSRAHDLPARRVLVVDDEPLIRWSVSETLLDHGFQVVESGDALSARAAIRDAAGGFDAVVLDLRLPDSEDLSLMKAIRAMAPGARIILMTAFGTPEIMRDALECGAFQVMNKPFEMQDVAEAVERATAVFPGTAN
jgi:DNA-binding NtrC family response regulator